MKMKKLNALLTLTLTLALFALFTVPAWAQSPTPPGVTDTNTAAAGLTPQQVQQVHEFIDGVLPLIPANDIPLAGKIIGYLSILAIVGRGLKGYLATGSIVGAVWHTAAGILFNHVPNRPPAGSNSQGAGAAAQRAGSGLALLLCLGAATFLFTGCGSIPHQLVDNESGTGLKAKIPVGYNGNNIFELDLTVGTFKHTSMIQPVETNRVYTPSLVVAAATRGTFQGGTSLSGALTTNSNPLAMVKGGDSYVVTTGHTAAGITNNADVSSQSWQDVATETATNTP